MKLAMTLGGTDLGRSGIGTYVREILPRLAAQLASDGGELVVLGTALELAAYAPVLEGIRCHRLQAFWDTPGPSALWTMMAGGREAKRAGCDVLLLPAGNRRVAWISPVPVVAVVHDLAQLRVAGKYDPIRMAYLRRVILPGRARATRLVSVSRATRDDLAEALHLPGDALQVVGHGVDPDRFRPQEQDDPGVALTRSCFGLERPYVLYLSRLELPNKNHLRLLQAFADSSLRKSHDLILAGPDWGGQARIVEEIGRLGLTRAARLLGFVPSENLSSLVAAADALTMVAMFEGFGLPALEALSCGVPVVASTTGALPEVVGSLGSSCDPMSVDSIRGALEHAVLDPAYRARVREQGPAWARAHGWEASAGALLGACRRVERAA